jgi:magnesium transporter
MPTEITEIKEEQKQESIREIILHMRVREIQKLFKEHHPADIAKEVQTLELHNQVKFINKLKITQATQVLKEMDLEKQQALVTKLGIETASGLINKLLADEAADIIATLPQDQAGEILENMKSEARDVEILLSYAHDTAGGIMQKEYISVPQNLTVKQAVAKIKSFELPTRKTFYMVYVTDTEGHLKGAVALNDLLIKEGDEDILKITDDKYPSVSVDTDQEEAAEVISKYDIISLPVIDPQKRLVGVITIDDVVDVLKEESSEDIFRFAGISSGEEKALSPLFGSLLRRIPWLIVNLGTAFLSAYTVTRFEGTISKVAVLAAFMPIVAGQGGNSGTQTATIVVRSLSLDEVAPKDFLKVLIKESLFGFVHGAISGLLTAAMAYFFTKNIWLAGIIFVAMLGNMIIAGMAGALIPLAFKRLKIDPALASSIWLTTFTDVMGFLILLGLGTILIARIAG